MSAPAAIGAVFSDYRLVKSRGVLQLVCEIPVERQSEAFAALGYPVPGADIHVALARLAVPGSVPAPVSDRSIKGKERYANATEREQAVVRAARYPKDERFRAWVAAETAPGLHISEEAAARFIRDECGIKSRAEIITGDTAYRTFIILETAYRQWAGLIPEPRG